MIYHRDQEKVLLRVPKSTWRAPSHAQIKDAAGNSDQIRFRLTARLNDGFIVWKGWFDDRDDADAFLYAIATGTLKNEPALWRLPTPAWEPDLEGNVSLDFATVTFLTTTGAGTYSKPVDWTNSNNSIECVGAGGRAVTSPNGIYATGGAGGGAYSKKNNVTLSSSTDYSVGAGSSTSGTVGGDTFFGATTFASSVCAAKGGNVGTFLNTAGTGGQASAGIGDTKYDGGNGGNGATAISHETGGGGGGAGPNGRGGNGGKGINNTNGGAGGGGGGGGGATSDATDGSGTAGGNGGNNPGGTGGGTGSVTSGVAGGNGSNGGGGGGARGDANGGNGSNGQEWDSTHGSGGAGGGSRKNAHTGGTAGLYGAGTPGTAGALTAAQGIIVVTYTPASASVFAGNMPMMGL